MGFGFSGGAPVYATPTWWADDTAHPVGTWRQYAGGAAFGAAEQNGLTLQAAATAAGIAVTSGVTAYSGAAVDQSGRRILLMGGGHGDYAGNEVYALDLSANAPAWEVFKGRSPGNSTGYSEGPNGSGQHSPDIGVNGHPTTSHTSNVMQVVDGKLWLGQAWGAPNPSTAGTSARFSLDLTTKEWTAHGKTLSSGEAALLSAIHYEGPGIAVLEDRHEYFGGFLSDNQESVRLYVMSTLDGSISATYKRGGGLPLAAGYSKGLYNGTGCGVPANGSRPAFILANSTIDSSGLVQNFRLIDPDDPTELYNLTVSNTSGLTFTSDSNSITSAGSMVYVPAADAIFFVLPGANANITARWMRIDIPAETTIAGLAAATWNVSLMQPSNYASVGANSDVRIYGRFNVVRDMGDGRPAVFLMPTDAYNGPIWVCKLTSAGDLA